MRIWLAFRAFFAVLFGHPWPPRALPEAAAEGPKSAAIEEVRRALEHPAPPPPTPAPPPAPAVDLKAAVKLAEDGAAVRVLAVLQSGGRLLDFLEERIDSYSDAQIGAAVRDIHRGCRKALAEHMKVAPIRPEPDEATVRIAAGHDASQVRLVGQVTGRPPFEGTLRHHGWRSTQINLPDIPAGHDPTVICPAEVEIGG